MRHLPFPPYRGVHCVSMYTAWRPVTFPTCHICNRGRLPGFDRETSRTLSRHCCPLSYCDRLMLILHVSMDSSYVEVPHMCMVACHVATIQLLCSYHITPMWYIVIPIQLYINQCVWWLYVNPHVYGRPLYVNYCVW